MSDQKNDQAREFILEAEKKLSKSKGFFSRITGSGHIAVDEAIDLYQRAGNAYKSAKNWTAAGHAFEKSAEVRKEYDSGSQRFIARDFKTAAETYRKVNPKASIKAFAKSSQCFSGAGDFSNAGKCEAAIAEIYESEFTDFEKAIEAYIKAADCFENTTNATSDEGKMKSKQAHLYAMIDKFDEACEIFEKRAFETMDNKMLRFGARELFLKAGICSMCTKDLITAQRKFENYKDEMPAFKNSIECNFLDKLLEASEDEDVEALTNAIGEYDNLKPLDSWMTAILLKYKKSFDEADTL